MTRRPPMPPDGNIRRAHQRMAPGGRLWSESPVRGPAVRVVAAGDEPDPPLYLYRFDDASGASVEAGGGPPIEWSGVPIYQVPAIAPGSSYAMDLNNPGQGSFATGRASFSLAQALDPGSPITVDVWISGLTPGSGAPQLVISELFAVAESYAKGFMLSATSEGNLLVKYGNGSTQVTGDTIAIPADPAHIVMTCSPTAGTISLAVNGSTVSSLSGLTISWTGAAWDLDIGPGDWTSSVFDDLAIYATEA